MSTSTTPDFSHRPVMVDTIVMVFATVPAGFVLDATLGGAGHSEALLKSRDDLSILGLDRDARAIAAASHRLESYAGRVRLLQRRFDSLGDAMVEAGVDELSGALFDLGVSSHQLDTGERGFSYRLDAPLDMRMDQSRGPTAAELVNSLEEAEIADLLRRYADERFAHRIARAIVAARPILTTTQLSDVVTSAIPAPARRTGGHPAKRTFQAIRIAVNEELVVLPQALDAAIEHTRPGGRVAVLSYHSGEDRIVKQRFVHHATGGCTCPADLPCMCGARAAVRRVRVPARPSPSEQSENRRSTSARLRVVEVV